MSQPIITNGSVNTIDPSNAKDINQLDGVAPNQQPQANQPNVRHIPIFVEGRDEPIFNKNLDTTDAPINIPQQVLSDIPQPGSIFNRVKDIPVKKAVPEFHTNTFGRSGSPARTIPINVVHTHSNKIPSSVHQHGPTQASPQQQSKVHGRSSHPSQQPDRKSQSPKPSQQPADPINKIQNLQKEVLELMDKVEKYKGGSRKDKDYIYLDEMLTQNLLKLDTIDTEGKENIKAARKEAINCINKCIQVLEAKTESADKSQNVNTSHEISLNSNEQRVSEQNPSKDNTSTIIENKQNANQGNQNNYESRETQPLQAHGSFT